MLEIHGSRYVTLTDIQRRIHAILSRTVPLDGAGEAHELLRRQALVGRAALPLPA